jgi:hypothetical protein
VKNPHVKSLQYRLSHIELVDYDKAPPLEFENDQFTVRVSGREVIFQLKQHYSTTEAAREAVDPYARAWEIQAGLDQTPGCFVLEWEGAEIIDLAPSADGKIANVGFASLPIKLVVTASYKEYPSPPMDFSVNGWVDAMYMQFQRYRDGKDSLPKMAYFCLTVLEQSIGDTKSKRRPATAAHYGIQLELLRKLGDLTERRGTSGEARKSTTDGQFKPYSRQERVWIEKAVELIIRRVAERKALGEVKLPEISMHDLPLISS